MLRSCCGPFSIICNMFKFSPCGLGAVLGIRRVPVGAAGNDTKCHWPDTQSVSYRKLTFSQSMCIRQGHSVTIWIKTKTTFEHRSCSTH